MDIFTLQTFFINAFSDYLTDKVFACSSPPVQGKGERFFGVAVVQEALHGLYNRLVHQVLPEQLLVQILLQTWTERPPCQQRGGRRAGGPAALSLLPGRSTTHPAAQAASPRPGGQRAGPSWSSTPRPTGEPPQALRGSRHLCTAPQRLPATPAISPQLAPAPSTPLSPAPAAARRSWRWRQHSLK